MRPPTGGAPREIPALGMVSPTPQEVIAINCQTEIPYTPGNVPLLEGDSLKHKAWDYKKIFSLQLSLLAK